MNKRILYLLAALLWFQVCVAQSLNFFIQIRPASNELWWYRGILIAMATTIVFLLIKKRERGLATNEKIKGEFLQRITASEMKALRSQMNPHFLYNSLNAIRLFILQSDNENAE